MQDMVKNKTTVFALLGLLLMLSFAASGQATVQLPRPALTPTTQPSTQPAGLVVAQRIAWRYSTDGGKTFAAAAPVIESTQTVEVLARATFDAKPAKEWLCLELATGVDPAWQQGWTLNGQAVEKPLKDMNYRRLPGLPTSLVKEGANTLEAKLKITNGGKKAVTLDMSAVQLRALRGLNVIVSDVVMGWADEKTFTLTCRTNAPVAVSLTGQDRKLDGIQSGYSDFRGREGVAWSPAGLFHRFVVKRSEASPELRLQAEVTTGLAFVQPMAIPPAPDGEVLWFAIVGDCRTGVGIWKDIADDLAKAKPQFVVHTGDVVTAGANEWEWHEQFVGPAAELFATVPLYCVRGNHEGKSPLYDLTINSPGKTGTDNNWFQLVGPVLMIGIDGADGWTASGERMKWLAEVLDKNAAKAKFIFLFTHYPPWTSGVHGTLARDGKPFEPALRNAQANIMPLLARYKATAVIAGHDHFYERSEPADGVAVIISGGGGAELRDKAPDAARQNPYSKVWQKVNHYCLVKVDGETCTLTALTVDGKEIDKVTWKARK